MFTHEYADVNGIRLHYLTTGKGKLIIVVHGFLSLVCMEEPAG